MPKNNPVAAGRKYGYRQGEQPDDAAKKQFGRGAGMGGRGWDWQIGPNGQVQWKATANHPDRMEATGGEWFDAPDWVQNSHQRSQAYFAQNPNASWEDFKVQQGLKAQTGQEGLVQDPATGNWYHPEQGTYDPNGYYRDAQGYVSGQSATPYNQRSPQPTPPQTPPPTPPPGPPPPPPTPPATPPPTPPPTDPLPPWDPGDKGGRDRGDSSNFSSSVLGSSGFGTSVAPTPSGADNLQAGITRGRRKPGEPFNPFEV